MLIKRLLSYAAAALMAPCQKGIVLSNTISGDYNIEQWQRRYMHKMDLDNTTFPTFSYQPSTSSHPSPQPFTQPYHFQAHHINRVHRLRRGGRTDIQWQHRHLQSNVPTDPLTQDPFTPEPSSSPSTSDPLSMPPTTIPTNSPSKSPSKAPSLKPTACCYCPASKSSKSSSGSKGGKRFSKSSSSSEKSSTTKTKTSKMFASEMISSAITLNEQLERQLAGSECICCPNSKSSKNGKSNKNGTSSPATQDFSLSQGNPLPLPTPWPSFNSTYMPTFNPTLFPTLWSSHTQPPSTSPSSSSPSKSPSVSPSKAPSTEPTKSPSKVPTLPPTAVSTEVHTTSPTLQTTNGPSLQPTSKPKVKTEFISPTPKCEESQGTPKPTRRIYSPGVRNRPTRQPVCTSMMESYSTSADTEATRPDRDEYPSRYGNNLFLEGQSRPSSSPTTTPTPPRVRPPRWSNMFDAVSTDKSQQRDESTNLRGRDNIFIDKSGQRRAE